MCLSYKKTEEDVNKKETMMVMAIGTTDNTIRDDENVFKPA